MCLALLFPAKLTTLLLVVVVIPSSLVFIGSEIAIKFAVLSSLFVCLIETLPLCNCAILSIPALALLVVAPVNVVPAFIMSLYSFMLGLSGLCMAVLEPFAITDLSMHNSQQLVDDSLRQPTINKVVILVIAITCYAVSINLSFFLWYQDEIIPFWLTVSVIVIAVIITVISIVNDAGIISDAAIIAMGMLWFVYLLWAEDSIKTSTQIVDERSLGKSGTSILNYYWTFVNSATTFTEFSKRLTSYYLSRAFLFQALIRIVCDLHMLKIVLPLIQEKEKANIGETNSQFPNMLQSIVIIFVYTELTLAALFNITNKTYIPSWELRSFLSNRNFRIIQILSLAFSYLWRLAKTEE